MILIKFIVEAAGYIVRSISTQHIYNKDLYVTQFSLIVLAPVLMAAACYIVFVCYPTSVEFFFILSLDSRVELFSTLFQEKQERSSYSGFHLVLLLLFLSRRI
jgi:hypothetical protein